MKKELKDKGPSVSESYKVDKDIHIVWKHRITAGVIDSPAYIRGIPKTLPQHDVFLAYLEWKESKPFYERWFLP